MTELEIRHLKKTYGKCVAVHDFSLLLEKKALVVIAGPSGCGKSTLLQCIAGLLPIDQGCICLQGEDITHTAPGDRDIAMVFQQPTLFPHLSVYENIAFGIPQHVNDHKEERIKKSAELLAISDLLHRRSDTLSGGQAQRVAIARAIVRQPKLFLMDEPLSSLDASLRRTLRIEIAQLFQNQEATMFYVTHDQVEAMTLADLLIVMKDGEIQQIGSPKLLYQNPANLFTASFLGKFGLNTFPSTLRDGSITCLGKKLMVSSTMEQGIIIGLRMEHIKIGNTGIMAKIYLKEDLGDEIYYHVHVQGYALIMKADTAIEYKVQEEIRIDFDWQDAFFFDAATHIRMYF